MLKVGDKVFYRNSLNVLDVAIGRIQTVRMQSSVNPYGIQTSSGRKIDAKAVELEHTSKLFAKCLVIGHGTAAYYQLAQEVSCVVLENQPAALHRSADLVMFTGGEDVTPAFYGEEEHPKTFCNTERDHREALIYQQAKRLNIPCVGICRGAQFLNVMNGGKLVQHVTSHTSSHNIKTSCGHTVPVSSTHHQMMDPADGAEVLAWAEGLSSEYSGLKDFNPSVLSTGEVMEPEVVHYTDTADLCVQFHPEMLALDHSGRRYFKELLKDL